MPLERIPDFIFRNVRQLIFNVVHLAVYCHPISGTGNR